MSFSLAAHFYNEIFEDWMLADNQYNEYERFLGLFDFKVDGHITPGGSKMNYYEDYRYPVAVDPKKHFIDFVVPPTPPIGETVFERLLYFLFLSLS